MGPSHSSPLSTRGWRRRGGTARRAGRRGGDRQDNDLRQAPIEFTTPPVRTDVETLDVPDGDVSRRVLVFRVEPSDQAHIRSDGAAYLRVGGQSHRLNALQHRELVFDRGGSPHEATPFGLDVTDLDQEKLQSYADATGSTTVDAMPAGPRPRRPSRQVDGRCMPALRRAPATRFPRAGRPDQALEISRYARNPRIARVCADFGITRELAGVTRTTANRALAQLTEEELVEWQGMSRRDPRATWRLA